MKSTNTRWQESLASSKLNIPISKTNNITKKHLYIYEEWTPEPQQQELQYRVQKRCHALQQYYGDITYIKSRVQVWVYFTLSYLHCHRHCPAYDIIEATAYMYFAHHFTTGKPGVSFFSDNKCCKWPLHCMDQLGCTSLHKPWFLNTSSTVLQYGFRVVEQWLEVLISYLG